MKKSPEYIRDLIMSQTLEFGHVVDDSVFVEFVRSQPQQGIVCCRCRVCGKKMSANIDLVGGKYQITTDLDIKRCPLFRGKSLS